MTERLVPRQIPVGGITGRLFADAHRWAPEPALEAGDDELPTALELAQHLLREIAEDPFIRGRQRAAARRYLRRLEERVAAAAVGP